jgi:putative ABC transport system substrate-binding protein
MPVIGFPHGASPNVRHMAAFQQSLNEAGFVEGENVAIEYRWAEGAIRSLAGTRDRFGLPPP